MAQEIFISHSSEDKATAQAVCGALEDAGLSCWIAPRDVRPGKFFPGEIKRAIERCRVMVLIFSAHSNGSSHVLREIDFATRAHAHIVNFRIEQVVVSDDLDYFLALPHWLDARTPPTAACLARLVTSVGGLLELPPRGPVPNANPNPNDSDAGGGRPAPVAPAATSPAGPAVHVAPASAGSVAAAARAAERLRRRTLARTFTDAALREAETLGLRRLDDPLLLEPFIRALARAGDGAGALRAAGENVGGFRDFALSVIAETQVHDGDLPAARRTADSCQDRSDALGRMARALAEAGDVPGALRLVGEMPAPALLGFDPRAGALAGIAETQARAGDVPGALRTAGALEVGSTNKTRQREARRFREATLSQVAQAQAAAGDFEGAGRTLAAMEEGKGRARAGSKTLAARARGGDPVGALAALDESAPDRRAWVVGCVAEAQAQAGDFDSAGRTLASIEEEHRRGQAIGALAVALARAGDPGAAFATARDIADAAVRKKTLARLALAQAEAGDPGPALEVIKAQSSSPERIRTAVAFASLLLEDPAQARWWMDFARHPLWD